MSNRLIYLDNSQINALADIRLRTPTVFRRFASAWRDAGLVMALSNVHVVEILQSRHADARTARMDFIMDLAPIQTDLGMEAPFATLLSREVTAWALRQVGDDGSGLAALNIGLPRRLEDTSPLRAVLTIDDDIITALGAAVAASAKAASRPAGQPHVRRRLRDLSIEGRMPKADDVLRRFDDGFPLLAADVAQGVAKERTNLERILEASSTLSPRQAFSHHVGASASADGSKFTDDLIAVRAARTVLRDALARFLPQVPDADWEDLIEKLELRDLPGTWLSHRVELRVRQAEPADAPSNHHDLDHVAHAPYVDVFFADRRMHEYLRQVPVAPGEVRARVERAVTEEALLLALPERLQVPACVEEQAGHPRS